MKKETEHELAELHEKERSLEKALELVREKIRELITQIRTRGKNE